MSNPRCICCGHLKDDHGANGCLQKCKCRTEPSNSRRFTSKPKRKDNALVLDSTGEVRSYT